MCECVSHSAQHTVEEKNSFIGTISKPVTVAVVVMNDGGNDDDHNSVEAIVYADDGKP